jgi:hypothetical protein
VGLDLGAARVAAADNEAALLDMALHSTASQLERICRGYRLALRNASETRIDDEGDLRWVRERDTALGFVRFDIQVTADEAAVIRQALEVARMRGWNRKDVSAGTRSAALHRADALVAVAESYLATAPERDAGPPVEVVVHVDAAADGEAGGNLEDGRVIAHATAERLLCDAAIVAVRDDSRGSPIEMGRRRRTIPTMHEGGVRIISDGPGQFAFSRGDGRPIDGNGQPVVVPADALRAWNARAGLTIDATANAPRSERRADYDLAVWTLMRLQDQIGA